MVRRTARRIDSQVRILRERLITTIRSAMALTTDKLAQLLVSVQAAQSSSALRRCPCLPPDH